MDSLQRTWILAWTFLQWMWNSHCPHCGYFWPQTYYEPFSLSLMHQFALKVLLRPISDTLLSIDVPTMIYFCQNIFWVQLRCLRLIEEWRIQLLLQWWASRGPCCLKHFDTIKPKTSTGIFTKIPPSTSMEAFSQWYFSGRAQSSSLSGESF